jgi:hypothetical protein
MIVLQHWFQVNFEWLDQQKTPTVDAEKRFNSVATSGKQ